MSLLANEVKENGVDDKLLIRVNVSIIDWMRSHIGEDYMKFVDYLNSLEEK